MTSRPPLGVQQRQPQRPLGLSGLAQRSASHLPPDPGDSIAALQQQHQQQQTLSSPQQSQHPGRNGALRRGGSRLKLELSNEPVAALPVSTSMSGGEPANSVDSSKAFTPSRIMAMADTPDMGDMSPHPSARGMGMGDGAFDTPPELPMPRRGPRFPVPDTRRRVPAPPPPPIKKDTRPKPWQAEVPPAAPRYKPRPATDSASGGTGGTPGKGSAASSGALRAINSSQSSVASRSAEAAARDLRPNSHADLFFWTGDHPEDQFTDHVIRNGYYDKAYPQHTESYSAKNTVMPLLKQVRVMRELSGIFTEVLDNRRARGEVRHLTDFKPPPRVTLTDTKREAWIKDLANPDISLRRLSRTIPHGIRGRVLLDQCLNKRVPTERAVWLAKCVGANEIRAVKRKGIGGPSHLGGEFKWIRDWTVCIEQFVEATVSAAHFPDWKNRIEYALRLARHISYEQLLDREHYAEWLASGLENSNFTKLPFWTILTRIHWGELLRLRKYARRVVGAIVSHLRLVQTHLDREILQPLSTNLCLMLSRLVTCSPESFVSPAMWRQYRPVVEAGLPLADPALQSAFHSIDARNEQLAANSARFQPAARSVLVKMLDATIHSPIPDDLSAQCWAMVRDKAALARTLLEWCTSAQRPELCKVYLTRNLLQSWSGLGLDVTTSVLQFLDADPLDWNGRKHLLFRLVSELVRSGVFSTNRYIIEWLIARGGLSSAEAVAPHGPCATRLLVEIPTYTMDDRLRNLRDSMLRRASYPVSDEAQEIEQAVELMKVAMGFRRDDAVKHRHPQNGLTRRASEHFTLLRRYTDRLAKTSCGVKLQVGFFLKNAFVEGAGPCLHHRQVEETPKDPLETFYAARSILETCQDYSMLAEVLKTVLESSNADLLASCCETLDHHFQTFSALGVSGFVFESLLKKLSPAAGEPPVPLARSLLAALASVAAKMPTRADLASRLSRDLTRFDRSPAVDACSPVSDNNPLDADAPEENAIERVLDRGTSIDKHTLERLFNNLAVYLQNGLFKGCGDESPPRSQIMLLTRLRAFDPKHFDSLIARWVQTQTRLADWGTFQSVLPPMVSIGCLSLPLVLSAIYGEPSASGTSTAAAKGFSNAAAVQAQAQVGASYASQFLPPATTHTARLHQRILQLLLSPLPSSLGAFLTADEAYRFRTAQFRLSRTHPALLLTLMRYALAEYDVCLGGTDVAMGGAAGPEYGEPLPLETKTTQAALRRALREMILTDSSAVARVLGSRQIDPRVLGLFEIQIERILVPGLPNGQHVPFDRVLELTNELTLPFCQLKLVASLASPASSSTPAASGEGDAAADRLQSHLDMFARAMDAAIDARNISWTGLLGCLSPEISQHLKNRAQARFLELLPSPPSKGGCPNIKSDPDGEEAMEDYDGDDGQKLMRSVKMAESLVSVIETIIRGGSMGRPPQLVPAMVEKLIDLWEMLGGAGAAAAAGSGGSSGYAADENTCDAIRRHWLPHLLTVMTLHTSTFDSSKASTEVRAKALLALAGLTLDLRIREGREASWSSYASPYTAPPPSATDAFGPVVSAVPVSAVESHQNQPASTPSPPLSQRVLDLALVLADSLPDDVRAGCGGLLRRAAAGDATLRYLFSWPPGDPERHWLVAAAAAANASAAPPPAKWFWFPTANAAAGTTTTTTTNEPAEEKRGVTGQARAPGAAAAAGFASARFVPTSAGAKVEDPTPPSTATLQNGSVFCRSFHPKRWELLNEPNNGENGGSIRLTLFKATKLL